MKICPPNNGKALLKIYNKTKPIDSVEFRVRTLTNPVLLTCNQYDETIFKGCQGVRVDVKDFYMERVVDKLDKFTITIRNNAGDIQNRKWSSLLSICCSKCFPRFEHWRDCYTIKFCSHCWLWGNLASWQQSWLLYLAGKNVNSDTKRKNNGS